MTEQVFQLWLTLTLPSLHPEYRGAAHPLEREGHLGRYTFGFNVQLMSYYGARLSFIFS